MHGGIKEFLQCMSEEEAMGVVSNLVRAQAIVGTGAAIREGSTHAPSPPCLVCPCSPDTCTQLLQLPSGIPCSALWNAVSTIA